MQFFHTTPHYKLKDIARFTGGVALLLALALVFSGKTVFLPEFLRVAIDSIRPGPAATVLNAGSSAVQAYTVPTGVTTIKVRLWGAKGGGGNNNAAGAYGASAGGGGYAEGVLTVTPGQVLYVAVGRAGSNGGWPGGGSGASGGTGGGYSGVFTSSTPSQASALLIAGGGGGGGSYCANSALCGGYTGSPTVATGGGGGGTTGNTSYGGGGAGTQSSGGSAGNCGTTGSALQGGAANNCDYNPYGQGPGGGGGGYFGGGAGGAGQHTAGGGGGGSGYCASSVQDCVLTIADTNTANRNTLFTSNAPDQNQGLAYITTVVPILSISANPSKVLYGSNSVVTWSADAATITPGSCVINGGGIANDDGGNNSFTPNGFTSIDQLLDTPTNNFATLNPEFYWSYAYGKGVVADGGLSVSGNYGAAASFKLDSGKWYWEYTIGGTSSSYPIVGIWKQPQAPWVPSSYAYPGHGGDTGFGYLSSGGVSSNGGTVTTLPTFTNGDIIGVAYDADTGKVYFSKNNTWLNSANPVAGTGYVGTVASGTPGLASYYGKTYVNFGQGGQTGLNFDSASGGLFKYTAPSGYKAVSTASLASPAISNPSQYFDVSTWTGGTAPLTISTNFSPDIVWSKQRNGTATNWINDTLRTVRMAVFPNSTMAESGTGLDQWLSNGYRFTCPTCGNENGAGGTYVGWAWDESPTAGTDAVLYTGNGAGTREIAHSLGVKPELVMVKNLSATSDWVVWNEAISTGKYLRLNTNELEQSSWNPWGVTSAPSPQGSPTFTTGKVGSALSLNSGPYLQVVPADWTISGAFTFSAWINRDNLTSNMAVFNNNQVWIRLQPNNENSNRPIEAFVKLSDGTVEPRVNCGTATTPGTWYHAAVTWDGTTLKLYINGSLCSSQARSGTLASPHYASIGAGEQTTTAINYFSGKIDEFQYYTSALSAGSITTLYNLGNPPERPERYLPFEGNYDFEVFTPQTFQVTNGGTNNFNVSGQNYIAYLFASKLGLSDIGTFQGNATQGTGTRFVYTGFKPKFVLIKLGGGGSSSSGNWVIVDSKRSTSSSDNPPLYANLGNAEDTNDYVEFFSNGFRVPSSYEVNYPPARVSYAAFADVPFKNSGNPGISGYTLNNSLRFAGSTYLSRTMSASGNSTKWTVSFWVKRSQLDTTQTLFSASGGIGTDAQLRFTNSNQLQFVVTGYGGANKISTKKFTDPAGWYHIVLAVDTTNASSALRERMYVDGVEITDWSTNTPTPASPTNLPINSADGVHYVGRDPSGSYPFKGNLADFWFIGEQQLTPTSFGGYDSNNTWRPKDYTGSRGVNGFHLKFESAYTSPFTAYNITSPRTYTLTCLSVAPESEPTSKSVTINVAPPQTTIYACKNGGSCPPSAIPALKTTDAGTVNWSSLSAMPSTCSVNRYIDGTPATVASIASNSNSGSTAITGNTASTTYGLMCPAPFVDNLAQSINTPTSVAGKIGEAFSFNGTSQYVTVSTPNNLPTGNQMSVAAWVKPTGTYADSTYNGIVAFGPRSCGTSFLLALKNNGQLSFANWCNDAYQTAGNALVNNVWNHVAVTLSGTTVKFYVNGILQDTKTLGANPTVQTGTLTIGSTDVPGRYFNGSIDDVRIYERAISGDEVYALANVGQVASGLKVYYPLDTAYTSGTNISEAFASTTRVAAIPTTCQNSTSLTCDWQCNAASNQAEVLTGGQPQISWCCPTNLGDTSATLDGVAVARTGTQTVSAGANHTLTCNPTGSGRTFSVPVNTTMSVGTLSTSPAGITRVRRGQSVVLVWNVTSKPAGVTCTVGPQGGSPLSSSTSAAGNWNTSVSTGPINTTMRYIINCTDGVGGSVSSPTYTIQLIPEFKEV